MHSNMTETSGQCHVSPRPLPLGKVRNPRPGPLDTAKRTEPASVTRTETSPREPIMYSGTLTVDTRKDSGPQNLDREFDKIHRQFEEKGHLPPPSHMSVEKPALPGFMDGLEKSRNFVEEPQLAKEASLADGQRPLESAKTPDIGLLGPPSTPPHLEREVMEPCERGGQMDGSGDADQLPLPSLVREDDVGDVVGGVEKIKWDLTNGASSHHGPGVNKSDSVKSKLKPHWSIKKDRPRKTVVKNFLSSTPTETTNSSIFLKYFGDRNPTVNMRHLQGEFKDALRRIPLVVLRRLSPNEVGKHAPQSRVSKSGTRQDKYEELTVSVDDAHSADVTERPSMNGEHKQARTEKEKSRKQEKISPLTEMLEQSKVWGDAKRTLSSSVKDSSKTADSVPSERRLDVNSNNQIDMESHSLFSCDLVDPKVASLSKTLRLACSNGKAADQIAFKKKKVGILGSPSPKPRSASSRPGSRSPKPGAKKAQPFIVDRLKLQLKLQDNQTKTSHTANTAYTAHSSSALKMSFIAKSKSSTSSADDRLGGRSFSGLSADVPCKEPSLDGWESRPDVIFDCGGPAKKKFPTQNERIAVSSEGDRGRWKTGAQAQKSTRVSASSVSVDHLVSNPLPPALTNHPPHSLATQVVSSSSSATSCSVVDEGRSDLLSSSSVTSVQASAVQASAAESSHNTVPLPASHTSSLFRPAQRADEGLARRKTNTVTSTSSRASSAETDVIVCTGSDNVLPSARDDRRSTARADHEIKANSSQTQPAQTKASIHGSKSDLQSSTISLPQASKTVTVANSSRSAVRCSDVMLSQSSTCASSSNDRHDKTTHHSKSLGCISQAGDRPEESRHKPSSPDGRIRLSDCSVICVGSGEPEQETYDSHQLSSDTQAFAYNGTEFSTGMDGLCEELDDPFAQAHQNVDNTSTPSNTTTTATTNNIQPIPTDPACLITCIEKTSPALVIPHREEKVVVESDMIVMQNYYYGRLHSTAPSADRQTVVSGCCMPPSEGGVEDVAVDRQTVVSGCGMPPSEGGVEDVAVDCQTIVSGCRIPSSEGGVEDVAVDRQSIVSGCRIPPSEGGVEDVAVDRQSIFSGCRIPSSEGGVEVVIAAVDGQDGGSVDVGVTAVEVLATPVAQPLVVQVEEVAELPKPKDSLSNQAHLSNAGILMINTNATACRTLPSKLSPARQRAYFRSVSDEGDDGKGVGAEYRDIELATVSVKLDPCLCSAKTSPVLGEAFTATAELADSVKIASQAEEVIDTKVPLSAGEACLIQVFSGTGETVVVKGFPTTVGAGESGAGVTKESFVLEQPVLVVTKEEEQEPAAATTEEFQIAEFISSTFDVVEEQVSTSEELTEGSSVSQDVITTTSITTLTCEDQISGGLLLADFQDEIVGEIEITQDEGEDVDEVFQIVNERDVPIPHEAFLQSLDLLRETERLGTDSEKASPARFSRSASPVEGSVRTLPLRESGLPSSVGQSLNSSSPARESVFVSLAEKDLLDMPLSAEKSVGRKAWLKDDGIEYDVLTTKTTKDSRVGEENEDSDATLPYPRDEHDARTKKPKKSRARRSRKKTSKKASNEKNKAKPSSKPQPPRVETSPGKKNYPKRGRTTKSYNKLEEFSPIIPTTRREKKQKGNNSKGAAKRHPLFKKRNQSATKQPRPKQKTKAKASETKTKTSTSPLKLTIPTTCGTPSTPTTTSTTSTSSIPLASSSTPLPAKPGDSVYYFSDSSTDSPLENLPPKQFFSDQLPRPKSVPATKRSPAKKRTSGKGRSTIAIESVPETTTAKRKSRPGQGKRKQPKNAEGKTPSEEKARLSAALFGATTLTDEDSESDELPTILPPKRRRQQLQQQQEQQQQQQLQHNQQQQLPHSRSSATTTTTTAAAEALASSQAAAEVAADMQERSMVDPQGSDRIMREFPRHNWLQYKILHTPTTSYTPPSASAGLASLSPPPASFAPLNSADLALALPPSTHLNPPVAEGVGEGLDLRAGRSSSRNSRNGSPERAQGADWTGEKLSSVANARNSSTKHRASGDDSNLTVSSADKSSKTGQASEEAACVTAFDGLSAKELEASSAITSVRGAVSLAIIPGSTPPPPVLVPRAGQPGNPAPGHAFSFTRPITDLIAANPAPPLPVSYTPRTPLFVRPDVANSSNSSSGVSGNPAPDGFLSARGVSVDSHPAQTVAENSRRVEEGSKGAVDLSGKGEQSSRQRRGGASVVPLSHPPPLRPFAPPPGLARGTSLTGHLLVPFTFVVEGSKYPHHQPHLLPRVPHVPHRAPRPRSSARRPKNIQPKMPSSQNSSTSDDLSPRSLQIDLREDPVASVPEIALDNQHRKAPAKLSKSSVHYSGSTQGEQSGHLSQCSLPSPLQRSRSSEALLVGSNSGESRDPGTATAGGRRKSWEQARKDAMEEKDEVEVTLVEHGTRDITARTTTATTASVLTATTSTATASTTPATATATTTASVVPAVPMLVPVDSNPQLREMAADATARSRPPLGPPPSLIPTAPVSDGKEGVEDPLAVGRGSFELDQSGGDGGAPLDLCIKKTDMLTGSRMRANLPVQLVLPQVQPRTTSSPTTSTTTTTSTSTPLSPPSPDDIIADTKRALKEIQVVIATTSSATAESSAFTTSLISSTAEDVGVTLTNSGGGVVSTPQTVPSLLSAQGGGVVTVGVGVASDVRGADTGVARAGATIAQPWPSVNAAGACVRLDEQSQQTEVQAARNMTVSAENTADLPNDLPMESQASLAPADAAEEERLRHQLRKLVELAARKEQERERLLMLHKRKAEILMEMESKRRRMGNTSTMATTSNQLPHPDTLLTGSHSTHSWHDSGEHNTSTSTSRVGGAAESRPGPRRFEVLQQAKAIALAAVDRSANSDRLNGPTQGPSSAASRVARADGSVLDLSRPASQDSSSGTSERGPLVHMISQAIQDWGKQKPGRPSDGEDAGPSENDGRGQAGGGAIRSAHQAPKDNCSPLHKLGPSPSLAPCFLRRKPVHEPPVPRSTHSTEAIPQSAHMQRPFQLAGSWIVPADRIGKAQTAERAHAASRNPAAATGQATAIEKAHERGQLDPGERATQKSLPSDRNLQGARGSAFVPREVIDLTREQREGLRPSAQGGAGPTQEGCGVRGEGDPESSVQADLAVAVARSHKQASGGGGAGEGPLTDGQLTGRAPQLLPVRPANVHLVPGPGADFEAAGAARFPPSSTRRSHGQPHPQLQPQPHPGLQPARDAMFHALQQQQQGIMMDKTSMAALQQRPSRMHAFPAYPDPRLVPTSTSLMNAAALRHPTALGMQRMPVSSVMQRDGRGMDVHPTYPMGRHPASATNTHFPALSQQGEEQNLVLRNPMEDPPAPRQSSRMMPIAPKSLENVNTAMMQQQQQQQLQRQAAAEKMHLQQEAALHMQQHHQLLANHQQQQHMQQYPQHGSQKSLPGHPSSRSMQVTHPHSNGPTYPPLSSAPTSDAHVVPMSMTVAAGAGGGPIMSRGASGYYSHAMRVGRGGEMVVQPVTSAPAPSSTSSSSSASVTQRVMPHDVMVRMLQMQAGGRPPFYPPPGPQPGAMDPNLVRGDPYSSASAPYPHHLPGHPLQPGASHPVMMHPRMTSGEGASHSVKASRQQQQHQQHLQQHQQQHHQHQQTLRKPEGMCEFCGAAAMYLCSKCRAVWYCSQPCQTSHWTTHGSKCKAKSKQVNKNGTA